MAPAKHQMQDSAHRSGRSVTAEERLDWLRLIRSQNVGPATFHDLINHCGSASAALDALPELSRRGGRARRITVCPKEEAEAELHAADRIGAQLVTLHETGYPPWLARIHAPPPVIFVKGDTELTARPIIAIVGARNGSAIGQKLTRNLAADLGNEGYVIASGLARGIDTAAHRAALDSGTIAVLAGGVDNIYPPENAELYKAIGADGLLVSERPTGFNPRGKDFPRRNRLISGMSAGVVVIEAAQRSGSLITARFAGEQGREVFAVPGNPLDTRSGGTNRLLKEGAALVTGADDIIDILAPIIGRASQNKQDPIPAPKRGRQAAGQDGVDLSDREKVLEALGPSPVETDEVIRTTGLPARHVQAILLELDLAGRLERHGQQLISLIQSQ